jgi:SAM-dependent methyltransferase
MGYSERLTEGGSRLTRFSHRRRYENVLGLMKHLRGARALDLGCGDGWILREAYDRKLISFGVGIDTSVPALEECGRRFEGAPGLKAALPAQLPSLVPEGSCDIAICTETLEHVPNPKAFIQTMLKYVRPGGEVIITVPIEVGPSLLFKQFGRFLANRVGPYGYEKYTPRELVSAVVFWDAHSFPSSHIDSEATTLGHKGFDYRQIEAMFTPGIEVVERVYTPFPALGHYANSTVMWRGTVSRNAAG